MFFFIIDYNKKSNYKLHNDILQIYNIQPQLIQQQHITKKLIMTKFIIKYLFVILKI